MEHANQFSTNHWDEKLIEKVLLDENRRLKGTAHACRASQRGLQQSRDRLHRANRDLGETAAFLAASLTTVTAVEAVINIAIDKIGFSKETLQVAFDAYIFVFALILILGALRASNVMYKRKQAEKEIDQAKKEMFEYCPEDQWPKPEE